MKTLKFKTTELNDNLAILEVVKKDGKGADFVALKPSIREVDGQNFQFLKFTTCNQSMQVDTFVACESDAGEIEGTTCFIPRRFIDACKCIMDEDVTLLIEEATVSLLDTEGNKIPFPVLNPDNHILPVPDMDECSEEGNPLKKPLTFSVLLKTETLVDGLSTFGAISGVEKMGNYTLDGIGSSIDEDTSSVLLMSSNGHIFRKGSINYTNLGKASEKDVILPNELSTFLRVADRYEDSFVSMQVIGALLVVTLNTTIAYFRLKKGEYVPSEIFDKILGANTIASCKVDADEFLTKLKLLEVSASSEELVGNVLGVDLDIEGTSMYLKNPKSQKTKLSIKAEDCSGEASIYINGTELSKTIPKEKTLLFEICSTGEGSGNVLKINNYHVMMPLTNTNN